LVGGMLFLPFTGFAYTDQITVKVEEAWSAAEEVLKPYGFHKIDPEAKTLETKWMKDRIVRKGKGVFKNLTSATYERRYRLKVKINPRAFDTEIEVRGVFQERPLAPNSNIFLWKKVRPRTEDFDVERNIFMRILNRLELNRRAA
jgi:hypothetical protein